MAYGAFLYYRETLTSNRSEAKIEAAEALLSWTEWKGMGTSRCSNQPVKPVPIFILILTLGMSCISGQEFMGRLSDRISGCDIDTCAKQFHRLEGTDPGGMGPDKECITLRTYWNCIKKNARECKGDLNYLTVRTGVKNKMKQHNCSITGATVDPAKEKPSEPTVPAACSYRGKPVFRHCGLFGDPHLSTFNGDFQTCKVQGAWPLVNNEHLTVQVTNDPVIGESGATATSKLTVVIKKNTRCASDNFVMYQAQTDDLPGSFYDGHTFYGKHKSVELLEIEEGKHIEINIRYIATTIVVRQIGRYFTFAIKMPEELVNNSYSATSGLCYRGCPASERINYQEFLASKQDIVDNLSENSANIQMLRKDAELICREANVVDFYFDSCVFDLMTTGDQNFTLAALSALQDLIQLDPSKGKSQPNRTDFKIYDDKYKNSATRHRTDYTCILTLTLLLCMLCRKVH